MPRRLLIMACIVIGALLGCSACNRTATPSATNAPMSADAKTVIALLGQMPAWTSFSLFNKAYPEERAEIERIVGQIAHYDLDTIRSAMSSYYHAQAPGLIGSGTSADGKLLILNHYLFDLPQSVGRDSPHFRVFGGWVGRPVTGDLRHPQASDRMDLRWPWSVDENGRWHLTGIFGGYFGPDYDVLGEFDYYRANFGKRPGLGD